MCNVEILHRAQIGQNAYTEYVRTIYIYIYIDNFPFSPQEWGSLRSPQLGECSALWGEREGVV